MKRMISVLFCMGLIGCSPDPGPSAGAPLAPQNVGAAAPRSADDSPLARRGAANAQRLTNLIKGPEQIDAATRTLGIDARLINLHLASIVPTELGQAIHLPIQISEREGGRKSLFYLAAGEEIIVGVYIVNGDIYYRKTRRDTGMAFPAQTGDRYTDFILSADSQIVVERSGVLKILDWSRGMAEVRYDLRTTVPPPPTGFEPPKEPGVCRWTSYSDYHECT